MAFTLALTGQSLIHQPLQLRPGASTSVRELLAADVSLCNLEASVFSESGWPTKTKTLHLATPSALLSLRDMGFTSLAHANNHAFDLGPPGIVATHEAARSAGLTLAGSGMLISEALAPSLHETPDGRCVAVFSVDLGPQPDIVYAGPSRAGIAPLRMRRTVVLPPDKYSMLREVVQELGDDRRLAARQAVGYSASMNDQQEADADTAFDAFGSRFVSGNAVAPRWHADQADFEALASRISNASAAGQFVVLCLHSHHWEPEWNMPPAWLADLTRQLINAGADVILGTGSPVLQPALMIEGKPVFPGLGNFVFHTRRTSTYAAQSVDVWRSVIVRLHINDDGQCAGIDVLPIAVGQPVGPNAPPYQPEPLEPEPLQGQSAADILQHFSSLLDNTARLRLSTP